MKFLFLKFVCISVCLAQTCKCMQRPEQNFKLPGAGVKVGVTLLHRDWSKSGCDSAPQGLATDPAPVKRSKSSQPQN